MDALQLSSERELERIVSLEQAAQISNLSAYSWRRHYPDKIVKLSPGRVGIRLGDVLAIGRKK